MFWLLKKFLLYQIVNKIFIHTIFTSGNGIINFALVLFFSICPNDDLNAKLIIKYSQDYNLKLSCLQFLIYSWYKII